jgi:hypothetical protein
VFLDGPFLISPSGFSNVNIHSNVKGSICYLMTRLIFLDILCQYLRNHLGSVMVSVLASSSVDRGFDPRLGLTKDYTIGIRCFSAMNTALRRKSKHRLARNQDNVSEWCDMSMSADCCVSVS